ncbi:MAG: hypothetical protein KDD06_20500 [Phaeodactylibacter sp.]|nr:hypothetical protein [Phaeodactylibacter sp.]MCB9289973.1 hypothetical protein [Lewinellaceae bacterium]
MRVFPVLIALLSVVFQLNGQTIAYQELPRPAAKPGIDLFFHYDSPRDVVIIQNGKLTHISRNYVYDENRPWVATPVDVSERTVADAVPLNGHQLKSLQEMIGSTGIMQLPEREYGAPAGQRSYDYQMRIRSEGRERSVLYRSNPSYAIAPPAFDRMKEYIWKLVTEVEY